MGTLNKSFTRLLLIGCAVSAVYSLPVVAAGNGEIIIQRTVQAQPIGRAPLQKDPNPIAVNTNPSVLVNQMTSNEMSDGDFAGIKTGALVRGTVLSGSAGVPGMNVLTNNNGLPGMSAGHGGGAGASISNSINRSISSGMAPLSNIGGQ
ncbi:hypothetical protein PBOI14_40030 [Pseudomonas sp. Boi14]|uniref:hypothetical protein n=1 Tax=Pseudomonas sp. GW456-L15 TaxID=2751353 RepID=UPI001A9235E2|nr:hypothetical protein [Pseudomonas sp. GW456-L15]BCQ62253.1 hypothetical protein PBOI14_40030 [Pseudomonas sp. Boi14]